MTGLFLRLGLVLGATLALLWLAGVTPPASPDPAFHQAAR